MRALKRLEAIASLICANSVADIGADHGFLAKLLFDENRAKKVIATDISAKSLKKADDLAKKFKFGEKFETRVGDGLNVLNSGEVDVVVIAGVGGYEITKILDRANGKNFDTYIFQPAQNTTELRTYLLNNNFEIIKDFIVKDQNKFYNTLEVKKSNSKQALSLMEAKYGLTNFDLKSKDFEEYLRDRARRIEQTLCLNKSEKLEKELCEVKGILDELYKGENNARDNKVSTD